jgi:cyclopropane-fatty-acyl-phospholipid synthase
MWEFYLAMSQAAFEHQDVVVFQLQIVRRQEAVPLTRDYMDREKARLRQREQRLGASVPLAEGEVLS